MDTVIDIGTNLAIIACIIFSLHIIRKGVIFVYSKIVKKPFFYAKRTDDIYSKVQDLFLFKVEQEALNKEIIKKLDEHKKLILDSNKFRVSGRIVDFENDLNNGLEKSDAQFQDICTSYDYYKNELKGNSYVDQKMENIRAYMKKRK